MTPLRPDGKIYAKCGSNHHAVIFRSSQGEMTYRVVSMLEAARRVSRREPLVDRIPVSGSTFAMSLHINDTLEIPSENGTFRYWVVKSLWPNGQVSIQPHNAAQQLGRTNPVFRTLVAKGTRKVVVDPIGRVFPAYD